MIPSSTSRYPATAKFWGIQNEAPGSCRNPFNNSAPCVTPVLAVILIFFVAGCATSPFTAGQPDPSKVTIDLTITSSTVSTSGTLQFNATVKNSTDTNVIWQVNGIVGGNSTVGTISNGKYTAPFSVPTSGVVTILAAAEANPAKTASTQITITAAPVISVRVAPTPASVQAARQTPFAATVSNDTQNLGVKWTFSGTGCSGATCGTISASTSASGVAITYTAPAVVPSPASVSLTATSVADNTKSASTAITVTAATAITVGVGPASANVQAPNGTHNFTATVTNDAQNKGITWTLAGAGCTGTACGSISSAASASGGAIVYTAPPTVPSPALVTLTATSVSDGTKSSFAAITVTVPPAISVVVSPGAQSVQFPSGMQPFVATVTNDSQNKGVTWTLSGTNCTGTACGTLSSSASASGVAITYTAPSTIPSPALVKLTATSVADGTKSSSAAITVTAPPAITVSVAPPSANVQTPSGTQPFTATIANDSQNKGVTWALSGAGCSGATCGTLSASTSASGIAISYTAPASVPSPATVTITATSVTDGSKSSSATITLSVAPAIVVVLAPMNSNVQAVIGTQPFNATLQNDSQNKGVSWKLSGAGCSGSTCGTLSSATSASGVPITYTAPATVPSPATVTLTATSVSDGSKLATATITVTAPVAVSVAPPSASVQTTQSNNFSATVTNDTKNKGVTWTLTGAGCSGATCGTLSATSSASGIPISYTAPTAVPSPATVTLKATSVADPTQSSSAIITVAPAAAGNISVAVTPKRGGLTLTQNLSMAAVVTNDVGAAGVTWSASGASCSGNACGSFSGVTTTAATYVAPSTAGVYTVTATSVADGSQSAAATIGVTDLAGVYTYHNDLARDGTNAQEYALTTANVNATTFGRLFSCPVDGAVIAQPLWVANLTINSAKHNVVFVATTHDTVYAFDADSKPCQQLWTNSLLPTGETFLSNNDVGTGDIQPDIGIIGTPVIDPASNLIYLVTKSKDSVPNYHQRLHALSLFDGSEAVTATNITSAISVPGTGDGSSGGNVTFNVLREHQRPGLVLSNGVVYVAFASHGDNGPYHGWVLGFDKTSLALVSKFNANPDGSDSGIWMSGGAPSVDSGGNLYFLTGNGTFDVNTGGRDYGDSTVKLATSSGLAVASYFTPADQANLEGGDTDHGSGGAAIIVDQPVGSPHQHLVIGGGKEGNLFLLDRDNLGGYGGTANPVDTNSVQKLSIGNGIFATAAFWNNNLYIAGVGGNLKSFAFNTTMGKFGTTATSQSTGVSFGFPGSTPSVSATGTSNGIVWAMNNHSYCTQQSSSCGPVLIYAFDASNVANNLWDSTQNAARDAAGNAVKFTVPTVANGKLYVGTRGNNAGGAAATTSTPGELDVYGLLPN
jgi:hypothetical protein